MDSLQEKDSHGLTTQLWKDCRGQGSSTPAFLHCTALLCNVRFCIFQPSFDLFLPSNFLSPVRCHACKVLYPYISNTKCHTTFPSSKFFNIIFDGLLLVSSLRNEYGLTRTNLDRSLEMLSRNDN